MFFFSRPRVAVLELFGVIGSGIRMVNLLRGLEALRDSRRARAVVLDIDSPGGLATTSEYLHLAVAKIASRKPVVAFIRNTGASGAYMAACAATRVVALPTAVVGSIGVISLHPLVTQLLDRLGVKIRVAKGGHLKDMGAFYREPTPEEVQKEEELVNEYYQQFISIVARARKMDPEAVRRLATGEVFTGQRAKELGLVDELGDLEQAIGLAASLARVPPRSFLLRPRRPLLERLLAPTALSIAEGLLAELESSRLPRIYFLP